MLSVGVFGEGTQGSEWDGRPVKGEQACVVCGRCPGCSQAWY